MTSLAPAARTCDGTRACASPARWGACSSARGGRPAWSALPGGTCRTRGAQSASNAQPAPSTQKLAAKPTASCALQERSPAPRLGRIVRPRLNCTAAPPPRSTSPWGPSPAPTAQLARTSPSSGVRTPRSALRVPRAPTAAAAPRSARCARRDPTSPTSAWRGPRRACRARRASAVTLTAPSTATSAAPSPTWRVPCTSSAPGDSTAPRRGTATTGRRAGYPLTTTRTSSRRCVRAVAHSSGSATGAPRGAVHSLRTAGGEWW
mmetsp:Transcript_23585/g.57797  ORF Transcript_23585/g.57797 Transcript_23585/m.57797 type:complete len:263 (+) Transcript_23585:547-1335(+)